MIETAKARDDGESGSQMGGGRNAQRTSAAIEQRRIHVVCADSVRDRAAERCAGGNFQRVEAVKWWGKARSCN